MLPRHASPLFVLMLVGAVLAVGATVPASATPRDQPSASRVTTPDSAPARSSAPVPSTMRRAGLPLPPRCLVRPGKCEIGPQRAGAPTLVLWGDSHAWQHLRGVRKAAQAPRQHVNLVVFLYGGCPPMDPRLTPAEVRRADACSQTNARALTYVQRLERTGADYRVLIGSGWEIMRYALHPLPDDATGWRQPTSPSVANAARLGRVGTPRLFRALGRLRIPVDVIGQMTTVPENAPDCPAGNRPYECVLPRSAALSHFAQNKRQIKRLQRHLTRPSAIVQPSRLLCDARTCRSRIDGRSVYADPAHINRPTAGRLKHHFRPVVRRLLAR